MITAIDLGLIFGLMALGVYITFRVLDFADLTIDGSFTTGAATAATLIVAGWQPWTATLVATVVGLIAGLITGLLNTWGKIHPLLAGILTQIALYSINLRIMGKANVPLLRNTTLFTPLRDQALLGTWVSVGILACVLAVFVIVLIWFLSTDVGLALRSTGDNESMARAQGVNTDAMTLLGLALSNGLVGLSGALFAQYQGYADIGMGIGLIVAGLASVIIGTAIINTGRIWITAIAVVIGSIIYRLIIQAALTIPWFDPNDMKLLSALIVVIALLLPRWDVFNRMRSRRRDKESAAEVFGEPDRKSAPEAVDAGEVRAVRPGIVKKVKRTDA
ncbi:ABC transporter permease [Propionimicrobium sp. PCR01-08-3]|uniref:ABC transporter permease n=1 Tax=Propionimicrobium sp. PCR01-08-3 TaxID=3052086 RepID=UPI00255C5E10|nr:ABC transporter permease [Propionimicrobium sp. PCR01-08-3]WIY82150.1 ABC transporter permease [Propionimicrobium sp. PCR01-08-3]